MCMCIRCICVLDVYVYYMYMCIRCVCVLDVYGVLDVYKGNNKITELRTILQRESQNS
jgi:hypothetical protein